MTTLTRTFDFTRDAFLVYKNTCLLKTLSIKVPKELINLYKKKNINPYYICINGVDVAPSSCTNTKLIWDFEVIRNNLRDVIPITKEENDLLRLEETLKYNSASAQEYYSLPFETLMNTVFTSELQIGLRPSFKNFPPKIEAEETVYLSDNQLKNQQA